MAVKMTSSVVIFFGSTRSILYNTTYTCSDKKKKFKNMVHVPVSVVIAVLISICTNMCKWEYFDNGFVQEKETVNIGC